MILGVSQVPQQKLDKSQSWRSNGWSARLLSSSSSSTSPFSSSWTSAASCQNHSWHQLWTWPVKLDSPWRTNDHRSSHIYFQHQPVVHLFVNLETTKTYGFPFLVSRGHIQTSLIPMIHWAPRSHPKCHRISLRPPSFQPRIHSSKPNASSISLAKKYQSHPQIIH